MISSLKRAIKHILRYQPLEETRALRSQLRQAQSDWRGQRLPFTPDYQGDLIFSIIRRNGFGRCLETGFATGSTALYMLAASEPQGGSVISIDNSQGGHAIEIGKGVIEGSTMGGRHRLFEADSADVVRRLAEAGEAFDFVFLDGWKTFDHLAHELYLVDRMLTTGGVVLFDDTYLPGVRQAIRLLTRYYEYREIDYRDYGQDWRLAVQLRLSVRSVHRAYRGFQKITATEAQARVSDPYFFRALK